MMNNCRRADGRSAGRLFWGDATFSSVQEDTKRTLGAKKGCFWGKADRAKMQLFKKHASECGKCFHIIYMYITKFQKNFIFFKQMQNSFAEMLDKRNYSW